MNATNFIHVSSWLIQNCRAEIGIESLCRNLTDLLWPLTKMRSQRWKSSLNDLEPKLDDSYSVNQQCLSYSGLCHEIILSESLLRIWLAFAVNKSNCEDVAGIAEYIIEDNSQLRKRAVEQFQNVSANVKQLANQCLELQKISQQSTDLMLSQLPKNSNNEKFAFDKNAFSDFVTCSNGFGDDTIRQANIALCLSFADLIATMALPTSLNEDLNHKIVNSIAMNFPSEVVDNLPFHTELATV